MLVNKIQLSNFRNFKKQLLQFSDKTTVIVGPNAGGKTNIIESIFLLSTGKSFHARVEEEMIQYDEEIGRVRGAIIEGKGVGIGTNLEVILTRGEITIGLTPKKMGRVAKKKLIVNGVPRRLIDFASRLKIVLFGPWDLDIVTGSPSLRRNFLDTVLSQVDREYRRASLSYEKGLRQRNRLLFRIREEGLSRGQLLFWNQLLIKNGNFITERREAFINFANASGHLDNQLFKLEYDKSVISQTRLEQYRDEEVAAATTLVGPHRDDFIFKISNNNSRTEGQRDLARFGSRGEQRMGILWLKMSELSFIEDESGDKPTLLLDDIFSELDHEHRKIVLEVSKNQQTIITTADPHYIEEFEKVEKILIKS